MATAAVVKIGGNLEGCSHNQFAGTAENVLQFRDVHGDVHLHHADERPTSVTPHQLPADASGFVGRADGLAQLDGLISRDRLTAGTVVIAAVTGTAGVGKTALVIHWAHGQRNKFPDGQLYVDLRGYSPDEPMATEQALDGFLHALSAPRGSIPAGLDAQSALYRSLLAERRVLIVLDNARSTGQIRPLLPGTSGSVVLVTSRSRLSSLVSREGAVRLTLDLLPPAESITILRNVVGPQRIDAEHAIADRLADQCAHLPLALRIAGERVAATEHASLADIVAELAVERDRLDLLAADDGQDPATAVRTVFSWSYRGLPPATARMFRLLGLHPGPEFSIAAAAALAGQPDAQARRLIRALADAHLAEPVGKNRYRSHDLLRAYALDQTEIEDSPQDRQHAIHRVLTWYQHTANAADAILLPLHPAAQLTPPAYTGASVSFTDRYRALEWCETERTNLTTAARLAAETGEHQIAADFPRVRWAYFDLRKPWTEWITTFQTGLASARQIGDRKREAWILAGLGAAHYDLRHFEASIDYLTSALIIRRAINDQAGIAGSLSNLGSAYRGLQRFDAALDCFHEALIIRRKTNDLRGQGGTLNRLGATYRDLGRFSESLDCLQRSLLIRRTIGDRHGEGFALHSLAATFEQLQRLDDAIIAYRQSLAVRREIGDRRGEADNLHCLGKLLCRAEHSDAARSLWQQALTIYNDLGAPEAVDVLASIRRAATSD